jgi:hypothetical protein
VSLFSSAKAKLAASKLAEEQLYAQAAEEVASGQIRQGLWADDEPIAPWEWRRR